MTWFDIKTSLGLINLELLLVILTIPLREMKEMNSAITAIMSFMWAIEKTS